MARSNLPSESHVRNIDLSGLIDHVLAVTLTATSAGGFAAAVAGALMGSLGVALCDRWGHTAGLVGGAAGTALFAAALPSLITGPSRNVWPALAWFVVTGIVAFFVAQELPRGEDWKLLRWALTATGFGLVIFGLSDPIRWLRTQSPEDEGPWIMMRVAQWSAAGVRSISTGRTGTALAGGVGGFLGSLAVGALLSEAGEHQLEKEFGHTWPVVVASGLLGAAAGTANGWWTWSRGITFVTNSEPDDADDGQDVAA
jgi:hypothetical protein